MDWNFNQYKLTNGVYTTGSFEKNYIEEPAILPPGIDGDSFWKMWAHIIQTSGVEAWYYFTSPNPETTPFTRQGIAHDWFFTARLYYNAGDARPYWFYGTYNTSGLRPTIDLLTGSTPTNLTVDTAAVLSADSPSDNWGIGCSWVRKIGDTWYMGYGGVGSETGFWKGGIATSSDGRTWTKQGLYTVTGFNAGSYVVYGVIPKWKIGDRWYGVLQGKWNNSIPSEFPNDGWVVYSQDTGTDLEKFLGTWTVTTSLSVPAIGRTLSWEGPYSADAQVADFNPVDYNGKSYIFYEGIEHQYNNGTQPPYRVGLVLLPDLFENLLPGLVNMPSISMAPTITVPSLVGESTGFGPRRYVSGQWRPTAKKIWNGSSWINIP